MHKFGCILVVSLGTGSLLAFQDTFVLENSVCLRRATIIRCVKTTVTFYTTHPVRCSSISRSTAHCDGMYHDCDCATFVLLLCTFALNTAVQGGEGGTPSRHCTQCTGTEGALFFKLGELAGLSWKQHRLQDTLCLEDAIPNVQPLN